MSAVLKAALMVLIFLAVLAAAVLPLALEGAVAAWAALALVVLAAVAGVIGLVMGEGE